MAIAALSVRARRVAWVGLIAGLCAGQHCSQTRQYVIAKGLDRGEEYLRLPAWRGPHAGGRPRVGRCPQRGLEANRLPPDPDKAVFIDGGSYPSINTLRIDFSDALLRPTPKKEKLDLNNRIEKNLDVQHLEVKGEPMLLRTARLNMRLVADGAQLDMERDRRGRPVMMLAEAKSGSLNFDVSRTDAEAIMLQNAREMAANSGVTIEKLHLTIVPETPRSLQVSLYVSTKVALIPAGMLFRAHVIVDDSMNARISGLSCDGDEALGPLIVHFLRPALARYNGRTRPLSVFRPTRCSCTMWPSA